MASTKRLGERIVTTVNERGGIRPAKGDVFGALHNILNEPRSNIEDAVMWAIGNGKLSFEGPQHNPTALEAVSQ